MPPFRSSNRKAPGLIFRPGRQPGFQILDQLLEIVALAQRLQPRVMTELVGVVEAGGDVFAEGFDCSVCRVGDLLFSNGSSHFSSSADFSNSASSCFGLGRFPRNSFGNDSTSFVT